MRAVNYTRRPNLGGVDAEITNHDELKQPQDTEKYETPPPCNWKDYIDLSNINTIVIKERVEEMMERYAKMYTGKRGTVKATENVVYLKQDTEKIRQRPYRSGPKGVC